MGKRQKYWATGLYNGNTVTCLITDLSGFINASSDDNMLVARINKDGQEEELGEVCKGDIVWETIESTR